MPPHQPTVCDPSPDLLPNLRSDQRVQLPVFSSAPSFRCPHCQTLTSFEVSEFSEEARGFPERAAFDKASRTLRSRGCRHRDFPCQGCHRAVRVVYGAFEFAMSSYLFIPEQVLLGTPRP
ncbi:hypothetical protein [Melittangium boletus]|uniref:Uncharacterized protein n=1 Tax=Melittangium boletus DSM 14713 TaxID=1294270 RepID=A0A250I8N6_9BACT|nr:hypothetical protein [Melittangium boletus]ATB28115.1 hypothetical protein MEBOL_001560 [Melittangium boletus DSM 14713]